MGPNTTHRPITALARFCLVGIVAASGSGCGAGYSPPRPTDDDPPDADEGLFAGAHVLNVGVGTTQTIDGKIDSTSAVDVYDLGAMEAGERLILTVDPHGSLDSVLAVFDADGNSVRVNDDRNYYAGDFSSRINMSCPPGTATRFISIASSFESGTVGGYTLTVTRSGVEALSVPLPQTVYLNFDGAEPIVIGRGDPITIPVFEASNLAASFKGRTEELVAAVAASVREDYHGLNVNIISSREAAEPGEAHTTIHFGAFDPGLFGTADYVDEANAALTQKAIVYVDSFTVFMSLHPSIEQMAAALANTASHETGHLLGLNHTTDLTDIMVIGGTLSEMLDDRVFSRAPLHPEVFPIGHQDGARLLVESVGGDLAKIQAGAAMRMSRRLPGCSGLVPTAAVLDRPLSTCFCAPCVKHRR